MIFRLILLVVVAYLGSVIFYSRKDLEPRALLVHAATRAGVVCLWTIGAFVVMGLIEWAWIRG